MLFERNPINMPTLIICPVSVLGRWKIEIEKFCSTAAGVRTLVYHGSNRLKDPAKIAQYDVVLTSYTLAANEATGIMSAEKGTRGKKKKARKPEEAKALLQVYWFRIVLDECQNVKNADNKMSAAVASYKAV